MSTRKLGATLGMTILGAFLAAAPAQPAQQTSGVKVGVLTCNVEGGWGFILGSSKEIRCNYVPNRGGGEHYRGSISKVGVDIGFTSGGVLIWNVVAPSSDVVRPGALAGEYGGLTASAAVGGGLGANVLLGGFNKSIALQPISIEGMTGLNVAAGIGAMTLTHDRT